MAQEISIVGAGIGGISTALALEKTGWQVQLFEAAHSLQPVGAGIVMAINAMQVFKKLEIHQEIVEAGNRISIMKITDQQMNPLSVMDLRDFEKQFGVHNVAILRSDLLAVLARNLQQTPIHFSKKLKEIEVGTKLNLHFEDESSHACSGLIAADGIHSVVRKTLFPKSKIRGTGQICWRGIAKMELPPSYHHTAIESWHSGKRFGFVKINQQMVYWYALVKESMIKDRQKMPIHLFRVFHQDIQEIIAATPFENIIVHEITDLEPIPNWHQKNICLMGDAAHATTPNLGQGACQAVEDAYTLSTALNINPDLSSAFKSYQSLRMQKANRIVKNSRKIGNLAHLENPILQTLRNQIMKIEPAAFSRKRLAQFFSINE